MARLKVDITSDEPNTLSDMGRTAWPGPKEKNAISGKQRSERNITKSKTRWTGSLPMRPFAPQTLAIVAWTASPSPAIAEIQNTTGLHFGNIMS